MCIDSILSLYYVLVLSEIGMTVVWLILVLVVVCMHKIYHGNDEGCAESNAVENRLLRSVASF